MIIKRCAIREAPTSRGLGWYYVRYDNKVELVAVVKNLPKEETANKEGLFPLFYRDSDWIVGEVSVYQCLNRSGEPVDWGYDILATIFHPTVSLSVIFGGPGPGLLRAVDRGFEVHPR